MLMSDTTKLTRVVASRPSADAVAWVRWYGYAMTPPPLHPEISAPAESANRLSVLSASEIEVACGLYTSNDAVALRPTKPTATDTRESLTGWADCDAPNTTLQPDSAAVLEAADVEQVAPELTALVAVT